MRILAESQEAESALLVIVVQRIVRSPDVNPDELCLVLIICLGGGPVDQGSADLLPRIFAADD
jgi:hypothetical protein